MLDSIIYQLAEKRIDFSEHASLRSLTTMRCGGSARVLARPKTCDELADIALLAHRIGVKYRVIGRMSNTLPPDGEYDGIVIDTSYLSSVGILGDVIKAECGARLSRVIWGALKQGLGGLEELMMIPASVGGAVYNNAGAHGRVISDCIIDADVFSVRDGVRLTIARDDMRFGYRHSVYMDEEYVLLSARFKTCSRNFEESKHRITELAHQRRNGQPLEFPSLGSVFKRYEGQGAGYYIERSGLKGYRIGDAEVSRKHAGFIINVGNATSTDVLALVDYVKIRVFDTFGITLEEEIEIL